MIKLYLKLIIIYCALSLGLSVLELANCHKKTCIQMIEQRSRDILNIDWMGTTRSRG